jgi:hypothetical protein
MTKPQRNDNYVSNYVYGYTNDMLAAKPVIIPWLRPTWLCQRLYTVTPMVTPIIMPMATPTNYFYGGLYIQKVSPKLEDSDDA